MLDKEFQHYRLGIMKAGKNMPLDYIMVLPKVIMKKILVQTRVKLEKDYKTTIDNEIKAQRAVLNKNGLTMNNL